MHWMLILLLLGLARPAIATGMTAYTEELPPLNYQDGGQVSGFATELLQTVMQQAGYSVDIQLMPWARAYRLVMEGPDRIIYSITRTPQREPLFHWVGPISPRQIKLYRLNSRSDIQINSEAALQTGRHVRVCRCTKAGWPGPGAGPRPGPWRQRCGNA